MKLTKNDLFLLKQCAISAAFQAGQIISQFSKNPPQVNLKQDNNSLASQVVTEVDLLSQSTILQILKPCCQQFDLALLTEESPDDKQRQNKDFFWCIDPLDGTLPFIESIPGYCVSIALVSKQGIPHIGVIYDPIKHTLYHAIMGQGVYRNNQPWLCPTSKKTSQQQSLTFITDRSFIDHKHYLHVINQLKYIAIELGYGGVKIIQSGGAAMNACWVIEQAPACYFKFPKKENGGGSLWDFAATTCLFQETNAVVSNIFGQGLDLNRVESTYMNHQGVLFASDRILADKIIKLYKQL